MQLLTDDRHILPANCDSFEYGLQTSSVESLRELLYDCDHLISDGDEWASASRPSIVRELKHRGIKVLPDHINN